MLFIFVIVSSIIAMLVISWQILATPIIFRTCYIVFKILNRRILIKYKFEIRPRPIIILVIS